MFDDGEAEACAAQFAAASFIDSIEAFEDARLGGFWDADAVVDDTDLEFAIFARVECDFDGWGAAITQGVVDEVGDSFFDEARVAFAEEGAWRGDFGREFDVCFLGCVLG